MEELLYSVAGIALGFLSLYLTAYAKAKGKNQALEEDVSRLEDEKQGVIAKYQAELQELKRQHALDLEKRKYLYEEKRQQFTKFFAMLDEFELLSNLVYDHQAAFLSD
jgi:sensor histidine kinase YesM